MAPENTSATPTTKTKEQPKQRVSVSDERKAHPSSANARRMSSATKTDASNQPQSLQADLPTQNAAAQRKNDKTATKNRSKSRETKHAPKAPIICLPMVGLPVKKILSKWILKIQSFISLLPGRQRTKRSSKTSSQSFWRKALVDCEVREGLSTTQLPAVRASIIGTSAS